jgi:uncharacterized membrane protein
MHQDPNQPYGQPGEQSGYQSGYQPRDDSWQADDYGRTHEQQDAGYQQRYGQSASWQTYNTTSPQGPTSLNLAPPVSAALSYVCGWLTGLIFLVIERRNRFVRFHAMQSILVFIALTIVWAVARILFVLPLIGGLLGCVLSPLLAIVTFLLWAGLIVLAFLGKETRLPILGDMAARFTNHDQAI